MEDILEKMSKADEMELGFNPVSGPLSDVHAVFPAQQQNRPFHKISAKSQAQHMAAS